jgi:O-antigen/teichoic acid export membrane protein
MTLKTYNSRNKKLFLEISSVLIGTFASLVAPFFVMPMLLKHLGPVSFGLWMTILSTTSMLLFIDLGIRNSLLTRLSKCLGKQQLGKATSYISSAYAALIGSAILFIFIVCSIYIIDLNMDLNIISNKNSQDSAIIFICIIGFIINIPISLIQKIQYSNQQAWVCNVWQVTAALLSIITTYIFIEYDYQPWLVLFIYTLSPIIVLLLSTYVFFTRQLPKVKPGINKIKKNVFFDLLSLGGKFLFLSIATSIALNADNIIIANVLSYEAVTNFAIPAKLASLLALLILATSSPLWPANSHAIAQGEYGWVLKNTLRMSFIGVIGVSIFGLFLYLFNQQIIYFWMERTFENQESILVGFIFFSIIMAFCAPYNMVLNSLGVIKFQLFSWSLYLVISIVLKLIIVDIYGVAYISSISAICYLVIIAPMTFFMAIGTLKKLDDSNVRNVHI